MAEQNNLSIIFHQKPQQWGLRGDPFLWDDMRDYFEKIESLQSEEEFQKMLEDAFEQLTGSPLSQEGFIFVPGYDKGGMSGGHVSPEFWKNQEVPLLLKRFRNLKR